MNYELLCYELLFYSWYNEFNERENTQVQYFLSTLFGHFQKVPRRDSDLRRAFNRKKILEKHVMWLNQQVLIDHDVNSLK